MQAFISAKYESLKTEYDNLTKINKDWEAELQSWKHRQLNQNRKLGFSSVA